jgi:DNA recombination protein RmuC
LSRISETAQIQNKQYDSFANNLSRLTMSNEQKLDKMRETVEEKLALLQRDNNEKLEKMRLTVDEKLHATLEQRLGESFKLVSERLELVHKGLGEMQSLAAGVGDLKKVLSNVKTRGIWGEISLANLLDQIFTTDQYQKNVATKSGSSERVEFAIKLPGRDRDRANVWLPIDAKFPQEDYQKLIEAQEQANPALAEQASKQLEARIKAEAKNIRDKYIDPPNTTDFAIMFLPTEGLYAEVIRRPGLCDALLRDCRIVVTGPTTLSALLNSLQIGFRTLAIEKRSSEVWVLLGAVKTEFGKFSEVLEKTQKKLQEASNSIDTAARKSRTIERKLKSVQELPASEAAGLLEGENE